MTICLDSNRACGGLDESPLEVLVDVAAGSSVPDAPAAGDDARDETLHLRSKSEAYVSFVSGQNGAYLFMLVGFSCCYQEVLSLWKSQFT